MATVAWQFSDKATSDLRMIVNALHPNHSLSAKIHSQKIRLNGIYLQFSMKPNGYNKCDEFIGITIMANKEDAFLLSNQIIDIQIFLNKKLQSFANNVDYEYIENKNEIQIYCRPQIKRNIFYNVMWLGECKIIVRFQYVMQKSYKSDVNLIEEFNFYHVNDIKIEPNKILTNCYKWLCKTHILFEQILNHKLLETPEIYINNNISFSLVIHSLYNNQCMVCLKMKQFPSSIRSVLIAYELKINKYILPGTVSLITAERGNLLKLFSLKNNHRLFHTFMIRITWKFSVIQITYNSHKTQLKNTLFYKKYEKGFPSKIIIQENIKNYGIINQQMSINSRLWNYFYVQLLHSNDNEDEFMEQILSLNVLVIPPHIESVLCDIKYCIFAHNIHKIAKDVVFRSERKRFVLEKNYDNNLIKNEQNMEINIIITMKKILFRNGFVEDVEKSYQLQEILFYQNMQINDLKQRVYHLQQQRKSIEAKENDDNDYVHE